MHAIRLNAVKDAAVVGRRCGAWAGFENLAGHPDV